MDSALRQRVQALLNEDKTSRASKLREQVRRVLAEGKDEEEEEDGEDGKKKVRKRLGGKEVLDATGHVTGPIPAPEGEFDSSGNIVNDSP